MKRISKTWKKVVEQRSTWKYCTETIHSTRQLIDISQHVRELTMIYLINEHTDDQLHYLTAFQSLQHLQIQHVLPITSACLLAICHCTSLKSLKLSLAMYNEGCWEHWMKINQLVQLESITIDISSRAGTLSTFNCLSQCIQLHTIAFCAQFSNNPECMKALSSLPQLTSLSLRHHHNTILNSHLSSIGLCLNLTYLDIGRDEYRALMPKVRSHITNIEPMVQLQKLTQLHIQGCNELPADQLQQLYHYTALTSITLSYTAVDQATLHFLTSKIPNVHFLTLEGCIHVDDACIEVIKSWKYLQHLNIPLCHSVTNTGLSLFKKLSFPQLVTLDISFCNGLTEGYIHHLHGIQHQLIHLSLSELIDRSDVPNIIIGSDKFSTLKSFIVFSGIFSLPKRSVFRRDNSGWKRWNS
jgi:hypothetical protein